MADKFQVNPDEVDSFSKRLQTLAEGNASATAYIDKWVVADNTVWGDGGLIRVGLGAISAAYEKLKPNYEAIGKLSADAATELTKVAQVYRTTDKARAEELDRIYPGGK
ncbi:type VII secretion target [Nocardia sp. IBHARD005]|uniref:type VII secretion target n=1 Tax=Nocardia sp. IBHARD005 TaxID=3457765 RepID=UPI004057DE89